MSPRSSKERYGIYDLHDYDMNVGDHMEAQLLRDPYYLGDQLHQVPTLELVAAEAGMSFEYELDKTELCPIKIPRTGTKNLAEIFKIIKESPEDYPVSSLNASPCAYTKHNFVLDKYPVSEGYKYITFLRDPVERVWSHWYLWKMICMDALQKVPFKEYTPRLSFANQSGHYVDYRNLACQQISGMWRGCSQQDTGSPSNSKPVGEEIFELAKANLDKFFYVGIFEEYDLSILELLKKMGLTHYTSRLLQQMNRGPEKYSHKDLHITSKDTHLEFIRGEVSERAREIIEKNNEYDIALYQHALKKWKEK